MEIRSEIDFFDRFTAEHGEYDVLGEGAYRRLVFDDPVGAVYLIGFLSP